jgi:hypothetical protein
MNLFGTFVPAATQFICIPFYLKALGVESNGLVREALIYY